MADMTAAQLFTVEGIERERQLNDQRDAEEAERQRLLSSQVIDQYFRIIHCQPSTAEKNTTTGPGPSNAEDDTATGPDTRVPQIPPFDPDVQSEIDVFFRRSPQTRTSAHARWLLDLLWRIMSADYGLPLTEKLTDCEHIHWLGVALSYGGLVPGDEGLKDIYDITDLDYAIRKPAHELGLNLKAVESSILLYFRYTKGLTVLYPGCIDTFWAPKGLEVLAFKMCYDTHFNIRLASDKSQMLNITAGIVLTTRRYYDDRHPWMQALTISNQKLHEEIKAAIDMREGKDKEMREEVVGERKKLQKKQKKMEKKERRSCMSWLSGTRSRSFWPGW